MSAIIAVSNQKGGVAKTTTSLSLGAALAELGHNVLLIDLDPQANLTLSLGFKPQELRRGVMDALLGNSTLVGVSRETEVFGLDIAPATQELALVDKVFYRLSGYQFRLREALAKIEAGMYAYIVLDCPPSLATLTLSALTAADLLIIPVQCELYAAYSLRQMVKLARQMREEYNPNLDYRVLVTMYDQRNRISRIMLNQLQNGRGDYLFETIIQVDTKLRESPAFGQPIITYASGTRAAKQYRALAQELQTPEIARLFDKHEG